MKDMNLIRVRFCSRCDKKYQTVHKYGKVCKVCKIQNKGIPQIHQSFERREMMLKILAKRLRY